MKHILENYKPKEEKDWTISISTGKVNTNGVDNETLKEALESITNPYNVAFYKKFNDKTIEKYKGTVGEWQTLKGIEIEKGFTDNLNIQIDGDQVSISSEYTIGFPIDWSRGDVVDWAVSPHDIIKAFVFVNTEKMMDIPRDEWESFRENNKIIQDVIKELLKVDSWEVTDGSNTWVYDDKIHDWRDK